ncbi:hypothetical protein HOD96_01660 [Candidatus Falkowbacteria bacterium]|jgi:hypothetical protein|nr:hypothetical protein [Candidatus Falkowbacteria bacterium]MBT4433325.1 hypothetical protein [Candidatus Falkowbacteria bacterium]
MNSLLAEINNEITPEQKKISEAIDIKKSEEEIISDLIENDIVSFDLKEKTDDQKT